MLQHRFIDSVRKHPDKIAFNDRSTDREVSYQQALLATFILARRFRTLDRGSHHRGPLRGSYTRDDQLLYGSREKLRLCATAM